MKYIDDINLFKSNKDFVAEIDMTGSLGRIYHYPQRMEGCLFLLCLRGECDITIHLSEHKIQKNDIVTILPETFVHVHRQSPDCRLYLIGFNKELLALLSFKIICAGDERLLPTACAIGNASASCILA